MCLDVCVYVNPYTIQKLDIMYFQHIHSGVVGVNLYGKKYKYVCIYMKADL